MSVNIFQNPSMRIPKEDKQIVRVNMEEDQIQGRKDHLPNKYKSEVLTIQHVPSMGK